MKLICKAFKTCYISMSPAFKTILYIGFGIFLAQQLLCGVFNVWYILESYKYLDLKNMADICFQSSYSLLAVTALISVFGDYVRGGLGPKN